jgi:hypothetical protein
VWPTGVMATFVLTSLMANMRLFGNQRSRTFDISGRGIFLESGCHPRQLRSRVAAFEGGSHHRIALRIVTRKGRSSELRHLGEVEIFHFHRRHHHVE